MAEYNKILVTGGAGFIGSNFIRYILRQRPDTIIINFDLLTYAGNPDNMSDFDNLPNYHFIQGDISDQEDVKNVFDTFRPDFVVHFAAESHVDRSITDPSAFIRTNFAGTEMMLRVAKLHHIKRFLHVSTDEVYGSLSMTDPPFTENTPIAPNSPYSASKAASDLIARAYYQTYDMPVVITRCSNNYGPYQHPEKLIPLMITNALNDVPLPIYGDGLNVRDWIYVIDHCAGILAALERGHDGEVYNLGGNAEKTNLDVVNNILKILGKSTDLINFIIDRPGHDRRYAMNITKAKNELGWTPQYTFTRGLSETVAWYNSNPEWIEGALKKD
ncbi:MAG: dTDP-glucose 4,6-dehydratase [bacterium]